MVQGERRRGRSRGRILYWFRTPPGVRVGRTPLDPEALRLIEQRHPDLTFDWPRILKGEGDRGDGPAERAVRGGRERPRPESAPRRDRAPRPAEASPPVARAAPEPPAAPPEPEPAPDTPAGRRLGAEGLARLRARHADVLARIAALPEDPARQAELNALAERLNPDAWATEADVAAGLEQYESVYESLRPVVGRRPRRPR